MALPQPQKRTDETLPACGVVTQVATCEDTRRGRDDHVKHSHEYVLVDGCDIRHLDAFSATREDRRLWIRPLEVRRDI